MKFASILALFALGLIAALGSVSPSTLAGPNCDADASIDSEEEEFLRLINEHRDENDLAPLTLSESLSRAAAWKSQHMAENAYFAHDDTPLGRTWVERLRDCGYAFNTWLGENIAAGHETAAETFEQWRNSPAHNANMLDGDFTAIGIGRAYDAGSAYGWYWTTDFGGETEARAPPPAPTDTPTPTPTIPLPPAGGVDASGDVSCGGYTDSIDAMLILQYDAGLLASLPCPEAADVSQDGAIDAIDSALILQYVAGIIGSLPP